MDKKIYVDALIDFESIDAKLQNFLRAREEFGRAAYELEKAVRDSMFQLTVKGSPLSYQDKTN